MSVDDFAGFDVHLVGAKALQIGAGIAALDTDFAEAGHVEHANALANCHVFTFGVFEPVLTLPRVFVFGLLAFLGKPVGALPTAAFTEHRAAFLQMFVDGRAADSAGCHWLAVGVMVSVEQAEAFADAFF